MPEDVSEIDVNRHELGPALKALVFFIILVITAGTTWYLCKSNTKGEIAESEIEVRKNDNEKALELNAKHDQNVKEVQDEFAKKKFTGDWATMSVYELRNGMRESEID